MNKTLFMRADEVAEILEVSPGYAYKLIKRLNKEQEEKGYLTMHGRLNREYFMEKIYKRQEEK